MARLCERPGCSQPAEVTYGIDADHLTVWIAPLVHPDEARAGVLCRRHADAMVVPLGWMLDDQRELVPRLFKAPAIEAPSAELERPPRIIRGRSANQQLRLDDAARADAEPEVVAESSESSESSEMPWKPIFDQEDDLDGLLTAQSPLLARAFRTGRLHPRTG